MVPNPSPPPHAPRRYTLPQKEQFVQHLTAGLMVDPARAGYVGREPRAGIPVPVGPVGGPGNGGTRLQQALRSKQKPSVSFVPVEQYEVEVGGEGSSASHSQ